MTLQEIKKNYNQEWDAIDALEIRRKLKNDKLDELNEKYIEILGNNGFSNRLEDVWMLGEK